MHYVSRKDHLIGSVLLFNAALLCNDPRPLQDSSIRCMVGAMAGLPVMSVLGHQREEVPLFLLRFRSFMDTVGVTMSRAKLRRPWETTLKSSFFFNG